MSGHGNLTLTANDEVLRWRLGLAGDQGRLERALIDKFLPASELDRLTTLWTLFPDLLNYFGVFRRKCRLECQVFVLKTARSSQDSNIFMHHSVEVEWLELAEE